MSQAPPEVRTLDLVDALAIERSHIVYELLHAPRPGVPAEQYEATMTALERAVAGESAALAGQLEARAGNGAMRVGALWSSTLRLRLDGGGPGDARSYFAGLGLPTAGEVSLYETRIGIDGAANLDVLEHIVRDRIGVYGGPHGRHVQEQAMFVASIRNLVAAEGEPSGAGGSAAIVYLTKPFGAPEQFRTAFRRGLAPACEAGARAASLWERKLGLGAGLDFTLRLDGLARPETLGAALAAVRAAADDAVRQALDKSVAVRADRVEG